MDVSNYGFDGAWVEIHIQSKKISDPFKFRVQPLGEMAIMAASGRPDSVTSLFVEAVIDWNLTLGKDPLPCDEKTKKLYLPRFATYAVKAVNGSASKGGRDNVAAAVVAFAADPDNFLKT